jgi:hypothetical protein
VRPVARLTRSMRLLRTLPALALLLGARASNYDTRELLDVCAYLDVDLNLPVVNILNIFGHIGELTPVSKFMSGVHCC